MNNTFENKKYENIFDWIKMFILIFEPFSFFSKIFLHKKSWNVVTKSVKKFGLDLEFSPSAAWKNTCLQLCRLLLQENQLNLWIKFPQRSFKMTTLANPLSIMGERNVGRDVRTQNVMAASSIANIVKSSLGPVVRI